MVGARSSGVLMAAAIGGTVILGTAIHPSISLAQPANAATVDLGPWLVGVSSGAVFPLATSFSGKGNISGLNVSAHGNLTFKPGPTVVGVASYEFNDYVAAAGQFGYASTKFDSFRGALSLVGVGNLNGRVGVSGKSDIFYGFLDGVITPLGGGRTARFVPLLGGGLGFASSSTTFNSVRLPGFTLPVGVTSRDTNLAVVGFAGADYRISERAYIGLAYQFVRINGGTLGNPNQFSGKTGALRVNIISALFEYRF